MIEYNKSIRVTIQLLSLARCMEIASMTFN